MYKLGREVLEMCDDLGHTHSLWITPLPSCFPTPTPRNTVLQKGTLSGAQSLDIKASGSSMGKQGSGVGKLTGQGSCLYTNVTVSVNNSQGTWVKHLLNKCEVRSLDAQPPQKKKPEGCGKLPIIPVLG